VVGFRADVLSVPGTVILPPKGSRHRYKSEEAAMVPFEVFWDRLKKELMTESKKSEDGKWHWIIPKWSFEGRANGKLSCLYEGGDIVYFKTENDTRTVSAHKDEFERLYPEWEEYCKGWATSSYLNKELKLKRLTYTVPTSHHFEHLMR
jgi:hypothetical protein